jgi:hypothetical protein
MKRILFLSILIVFFTTSFMSIVGCNNNQTRKEQSKEDYDLQERCGKQCHDFFQNKYGNGTKNDESEYSHSTYRCHYNQKLNRCFILVTSRGYTKIDTKIYNNKSLFDINENKEFGVFDDKKTSIICILSGKKYKSKEEWDLLVKPYMEE